MNRKGASLEAVMVTFVIAIIVILSATIVYKIFFGVAKEKFSATECQASLLLTRAVDQYQPFCWAKVDTPVPIKCDRNFITLDDETKTLDGKPSKYLGCEGETCQKKVVADEMRACWGMFFEGESIVLQQFEKNEPIISRGTYARACFICSEISIQTKDDLEGFAAFLNVTKFKKIVPGSTAEAGEMISYYDYLASNKNAWCSQEFKKIAPTCYDGIAKGNKNGFFSSLNPWGEGEYPDITIGDLKTGQKYAVVFMRRGIGSCSENADKFQAAAATNTIALVPADQIGAVCDLVVT